MSMSMITRESRLSVGAMGWHSDADIDADVDADNHAALPP